MGLFTLHYFCVYNAQIGLLKSKLNSKSRLAVSEFSGYQYIGAIMSFIDSQRYPSRLNLCLIKNGEDHCVSFLKTFKL